MIDFKDFDDNISDEMLAAYIDGNASLEEKFIIEHTNNNDGLLDEAIDIVRNVSCGSEELIDNLDFDENLTNIPINENSFVESNTLELSHNSYISNNDNSESGESFQSIIDDNFDIIDSQSTYIDDLSIEDMNDEISDDFSETDSFYSDI